MRNFSTRWMMVASLAGIGALALTAGCSSDSGNGGTGGKTGSGGGSGADAGAPKVDYTFTTSVESWALSTYVEVAPSTSFNLGGMAPATDGGTDAGLLTDAGTRPPLPTLTFDMANGNPAAGSLEVTATFTDFNQYVDVVINPSPLVDLTKQPILSAEVRLTSGMFSGGGQIHVSTGATFNAYGQGTLPTTVTTVGTWVNGRLDLSTVTTANFDASMVAQIGVQLYSGSATGDGGTYPNANIPCVFNIDTVVSGAE